MYPKRGYKQKSHIPQELRQGFMRSYLEAGKMPKKVVSWNETRSDESGKL